MEGHRVILIFTVSNRIARDTEHSFLFLTALQIFSRWHRKHVTSAQRTKTCWLIADLYDLSRLERIPLRPSITESYMYDHTKGEVSSIVPSAPTCSCRHFIRMLWTIRFHPSHGLFSRLINHSTVSLTIPLGDEVCLFVCLFFVCLFRVL